MKVQHKYFVIITAIALIISLPPAICYKCLSTPSDNKTADNKTTGISSGNASQNNPADKEHTNISADQDDFVILVDPGHGGFDPGKVSPDGIEEKKINLEISLKLKNTLTANGFSVFLTRDTDCSLNTPNSKSKKASDLRCRIKKAAEINADLYISIHQNSYSAEYVHGAQVFYYSTSRTGKSLAEAIQTQLISDVDPDNSRTSKGNSDYLVLVESPCTAVIVECGFLSNTAECQKLCDPDYQTNLANAIADAIVLWKKSQTPSSKTVNN